MIAAAGAFAQSQTPPTLRIVTEDPNLPSDLYYGNIKVKPLRLRPGTNQVITIDDKDFFIQQQYIDFLGRMPDGLGFQNWMNTLSNCPNGGYGENDNPDCDRVHVSAGMFLSDEFRGRGFWVYRFYQATLGRRPKYAEFVPDMQRIGGSQSPDQEAVSKNAYMNDWVNRGEFKAKYDAITDPAAFVDAILQTAGVTISNRDTLVNSLKSGQMTRAQVVRAIIENPAIENNQIQYYIPAFVSMQYFGYLRRDPDELGFNNWVQTLRANPSDYRHMIFGFIYSTEYRNRF
jgi:hypothetical protein